MILNPFVEKSAYALVCLGLDKHPRDHIIQDYNWVLSVDGEGINFLEYNWLSCTDI